MKRTLILLFTFTLGFGLFAQEEVPVEIKDTGLYPTDRESIQQLIEEGTFDKVEYDKYIEEIHVDSQAKMGGGGGGGTPSCSCYQEPDETYIQLQQGQFSPGALDGSVGPYPMGFDFCFFGDTRTQFWINTKGTITFNGPNTTFVPTGFPSNAFSMIAGFWADIDIRGIGDIYYKITETAVYVNFVEVGYYNLHTDRVNSFQIIMTDGTDPVIGEGNNLAFCYKDMQWAAGDWNGGSGGFGGSAAATVGANRGSNNDYFQIGRFLTNSSNYDGPFGANDGVNWLDCQSFILDACFASDNIPPIPSTSIVGDTLYLCQGDTLDIDVQFFAPEDGQTVTIEVDDSDAPGFILGEIVEGDYAEMNGQIIGSPGNIGSHTLTITGTDDGTPEGVSTVSFTIIVSDIEIPQLTISGTTEFCGGGSAQLSASDGFDSYNWSTGCLTQDCEVNNGGEVIVTGFFQGCSTSASVEVIETEYFIPDLEPFQNPICSNDTSLICLLEEDLDGYDTFAWDTWLDFDGTIYGDTTQSCIQAGAGTYVVYVETPAGCVGQRVFTIGSTDANIPEDNFSGAYCDGLEDVEFCCGSTQATPGNFTIYFFTSGGNAGPWNEGSTIDVIMNGEVINEAIPTAQEVEDSNGLIIYTIPIVYGDYIEIVYNNTGNSSVTGGMSVFNCTPFPAIPVALDENGGTVFESFSSCNYVPAPGEWTVLSGPEGWSMTEMEEYNSVFTPGDFGVYELEFFSQTCGIPHPYTLEFNEIPTVSILEDDPTGCEGDNIELNAEVSSVLNDAEVSWSPGNEETLSITVSETDTYQVSAENNCGTATDEVFVDILPIPVADLAEGAICDGSPITLDPVADDHPSLEYDWSNGLPSDPEVSVSSAGTYSVTVSNICGSSTDEVTIDEIPVPNAVLQDGLICGNDQTTLDPISNDDPSFEYEWTGVNSTSPEVTVGSGSYSVTVSNDCGSSTASADITVLPIPTASLQDVTLCDGESTILDPENVNDPSFIYQWAGTFINTPELEVSETGTYTVTIDNECGSATATSDVTAVQEPISALEDAVICAGQSTTLTAVSNDDPTLSYSWSTGDDTPSITVNEEGTYFVTITNDCGTSLSESADVSFAEPPNIFIVLDTLRVCPGIEESLETIVYEGDWNSVIWTLDGELFSNAQYPTVVSEDIPGEYVETGLMMYVDLIGPCGSDSDSLWVKPTLCALWGYNVISPNDDGVNDTFVIGGSYFFDNLSLKVFNRWGNLVYDDDDYQNDWKADGLEEGTYYYIAVVPNGGPSLEGYFTLVR